MPAFPGRNGVVYAADMAVHDHICPDLIYVDRRVVIRAAYAT